MIVLLGAGHLDAVAQADVDGEVAADSPIVLHEEGGAVPAVVIGYLDVAHSDAAVDDAKHIAGPGAAAGAGGSAGGIGLDVAEGVDAAESAEERNHVLQRVGDIHAELQRHIAVLLIDDVGNGVALFLIVDVGGAGAAEAGGRTAAIAERLAGEEAAEAGQAAGGDAGEAEGGVQIRAGAGIPLRINGVAEAAARVVEAEVVEHGRRDGVGIREKDLLAPAIEGAVVRGAKPACLES